MQLTTFTDYSIRVLILLAVYEDELVSISQISEAYDISRNHLMKVVHQLGQLGFIETIRGRGGGIRLTRPAEDIVLGDVVRKTEPSLNIVECFDPTTDRCAITPACALRRALYEARSAFLGVLDNQSLADMLTQKQQLAEFLPIH